MTGSDANPATLLSDKLALVTHHHLLTRVPVKLDLDDWNYGSWEFFFDQLCFSYDVHKFIHGITDGITDGTTTSNPPPLTPKELKINKIIESLMTILASLDSPVKDEGVVHYALAGLPNKYDQMRLKTNANALHADSSSLMVLVAKSGNPRRSSSTPHVKPWQHCFNFAKGTCRFGDGYHFVHDPNVKITPNNNVEVNASNMDELLVKLLSRLGMSNMDVKNTLTVLSGTSTVSQISPVAYHVSPT
ncbi:hybrid signal transduction histidine kinase M [Tanacetum coccineum]